MSIPGFAAALLLAVPLLLASGCVGAGPQEPGALTIESAAAARPVIGPGWRSRLVDERFWDWEPLEFSQPQLACRGDLVVVGTSSGALRGVDRRTGEVLWTVEGDHRIDARPTAVEDRILVGNDAGELLSVECNGHVAWRVRLGAEIDGAVAVLEERVFAQDGSDKVFALDQRDGHLLWTFERPAPEYFTLNGFSAPAAVDGGVYVGFGDGSLVALDAASGKVRWQHDLSNGERRFMDVDGQPLVLDDLVYAASYAGGLYGLKRADGTVQWRVDITGAAPPIAEGDVLYTTTASRYVLAVDRHSGAILWRIRHEAITPTLPVAQGDYLVYGATDNGVYVVDRATGYPLVRFDPASGFNAPVTLAGREGYLLSNGGYLYQFWLLPP